MERHVPYDNVGKLKEHITVLDTDDSDSTLTNRVIHTSYAFEEIGDEVYYVQYSTRYNAEGEALTTTTQELRSQLSNTVEARKITLDERGNMSVESTLFNSDSLYTRHHIRSIPTSDVLATTTVIDGLTVESIDHLGGPAVPHVTIQQQVLSRQTQTHVATLAAKTTTSQGA